MKRKWLVLFAVGPGLSVLVFFSMALRPKTPEQLLLAKSTRLRGGPRVLNAMTNNYEWVDSSRIFTIGMTSYSFKDGSGSEYGTQPVFVTMTTGIQKPLKSLIASFDGKFLYNTEQYAISPDGQWLLFKFNGEGHFGWTTTSWKGAWQAPHPAANTAVHGSIESDSAAWLPDSQSWGELATQTNSSRLMLHNLATGHSSLVMLQTPAESERGYYFDPGEIVGFTRSHHMITRGQANALSSVLMDWSFQGKTAIGKILSEVPNAPDEVTLSPDEDKLAWRLQSSYVKWIGGSHIGPLLHKWHLCPPPTVEATSAIWISNLDGSQMHQVTPDFFVESLTASSKSRLTEYPRNLHWIPSSKRISFDYKNVVYTIPAE